MNRRLIRIVISGFVLALVLAACGGAPKPQLKQSDFSTSISDFTQNTMGVAAEATQDLALMALQDLSSKSTLGQSLTAATMKLASLSQRGSVSVSEVSNLIQSIIPSYSTLPRKKYTWDSTNSEWQEVSTDTGDHLIFTWTFEDEDSNSHNAVLDIDWAHGSPTKNVTSQNGQQVEVPQHAYVSLTVDGNLGGSLDGQFAWYSGSCGTIMEPTEVNISVHVGSSSTLDVEFHYKVESSSMFTSGSIMLKSGSDQASVGWEMQANGTITRGDDCFIKEFDVSDGHVKLTASSTSNGDTQSLEFYTNFAINYDDEGNMESIGLSNGYLTLNHQVACTFEGTLDDENGNGIPGENVTVHFADGDTTLEQVLQDNGFNGFGNSLSGSF